MTKMTKKILVVFLVLVMVVGVFGCKAETAETETAAAAEESSSTPYKAAFITQALSNESQAYAWKQFQAYCGEYGFEMDVFEGQNDVQNEAKAVSTCIAQDYDAIFINPSDINAIVPSLMEAKEAGVIVGMFSSDLPEESQQYRDFFCGVDDTMAGQTAGQAFVDHFTDGATIVEVGGQAGHDAQIKRHDGFMEAIEGSNITLLDSQNCSGWVTADAMAIMEDFIVKYGDQIQGVFCHWDNGATGVIEALKNANMTDVYVVAVDGCRAGYDQVKDGTQAVCIGQSFTNMAIKSLECAKAMLEGGSYEAINFIPLDVVTADNIDTFPYPEW
ncbi:MAG TPA: sugar ABC transporter substrate-binding protein [Eubacteriales bacterium]|nr:sugar ABC transporter substrate-binding protein [Eubacteriales bacterium]